MGVIEMVGFAFVSGAGTTTVAIGYTYRFRIRRIVRARIFARKHDFTRNRKFVAHDRDRHEHRVAAADQWMAEWATLLGSPAPISSYHEHLVLIESIHSQKTGEIKRKMYQREAEEARLSQVILDANAAKQRRILQQSAARMTKAERAIAAKREFELKKEWRTWMEEA